MNQTIPIATGDDVVDYVRRQHAQIKALFQKVILAEGTRRKEAFDELRRLMAIHETAEEEVVHPAARRALPAGDAIVAARLHEEHEAKKALARLETLGVDTPAFSAQIRALQANVLAHAEAEEQQELDRLRGKLDDARLQRMRRAVRLAETIAPTHPHAGIESAAANLLVGPFAAMVDRARDALAGKR